MLEFARRADIASLKAGVDKLDIDELKTVLTDINKVSNVVDMVLLKGLCMIKKCMIKQLHKLMPLVLSTSGFVSQTKYQLISNFKIR